MHFIGNRAVVLAGGVSDRQISYSAGFTGLSFFLPIVVLFGAFYILGLHDQVRSYFILAAGVLAGTAICGMHYVGQLGISNYSCTYKAGNVVGAAAIAVVASIIALSVFFRIRESWTDSWWKRSMCGAVLAIAVSGMHWTAAVGTIYHFKTSSKGRSGHSRIQTVIVCTVLSIVACGVLLGFSLFRTQKKRVQKTRAQQLVLATAYFDEDGRVMVTPEGNFPNVKITNHYVEKTFGEDELSRTHPAFIWVYKASRNWSGIKDLIPGMQEALELDPVARKYQSNRQVVRDDESDLSFDFAIVFKQLFCVAAQNLAKLMQEPLEQLGVLFEEPMATGAVGMHRYVSLPRTPRMSRSSMRSNTIDKDLNQAPYQFGRGQYLCVTKQVSKDEVEKFQAQGYRFATIKKINDPLARSMQVPKEWMLRRLERMRICSSPNESLTEGGTHLACFMLRPSTVHKSFDILVPLQMQNRLLTAQLQSHPLTPKQRAFLQRFDEQTVEQALKLLVSESGSLAQPEEQEFRWHFYQAIERLVDSVGDAATMMGAVFSAQTVEAPCRPLESRKGSIEKRPSRLTTDTVTADSCTLICVRFMQSINASSIKEGLGYVPLSFFGMQTAIDNSHGSWKEVFRRSAREEFRFFIGGQGIRGRSLKSGEAEDSSRSRTAIIGEEGQDLESGSLHHHGAAMELIKLPETHIGTLPVPDTPTSSVRMSFTNPHAIVPNLDVTVIGGVVDSGRQSDRSTSPIMASQGQTGIPHVDGSEEDTEPPTNNSASPTMSKVGVIVSADESGGFRGTYVHQLFKLFRL